MERTLTLTLEPIDVANLSTRGRRSRETGAVVQFVGVVRGSEDGKPIQALEYECFRDMAEHQFRLLFDQVEHRWPVESVHVVHRVGMIPVNQPSLWVEVVAAHRQEAFAACEWLIEEMKKTVPIWKKPLP